MSSFFKRTTTVRLHILLLICSIGFSAKAELPFGYVPSANKGISEFEHLQPDNGFAEGIQIVIREFVVSDSPDSIVYHLTPTLTVVTKPLGTVKNNANVTFYAGSILLYTVTVTQTSPVSVCSYNLLLGSVKIEQGMQLTLQIPSSLQPGSIFLQATYSDLNVPQTTINAMVATWSMN